SAFKVPAPKPTLQQRLKTVSSIEETLGTNWLNKLGIIILVVGVSLFGIYELGALGPLGKAGISYFTAILLLVGGIALEKRERYRLLGRTGIGGGWALLFFSTYGIYHVSAMRVFAPDLAWLTVDCALMLFVAVTMALHTLRYRSQFVTGLAFLLGYFTVSLSQRSEEHTSELQSRGHLVCRLLLEKKKHAGSKSSDAAPRAPAGRDACPAPHP